MEIYILIALFVGVVLMVARIRIDEYQKIRLEKQVIKTSQALNYLLKENEQFEFYDFSKPKEYYANVDTKDKYDRFNFDYYMMGIINTKRDEIESVRLFKHENDQIADDYTEVLNRMSYMYEHQIESDAYKLIEAKLIEEIKLDYYKSDPVWRVVCCYISPQARNSYKRVKDYSLADIDELIQISLKEEKRKDTMEYQRSLVTPTLRYEVMRRDRFRCCICGRNVQDGVVLHVDHIKPVSKGGKTELSNLRTLCSTCNWGKGAKYEENGLN